MDEIGYGMEIYFSSRTGQQYTKTAFILCDDYVELISKLWLVENVTDWKDREAKSRYKNFQEILDRVGEGKKGCTPPKRLLQLIEQMKERRSRRNDFFHSTHLLDLNINKRGCVEVFCDLVEYGELLFGDDWRAEIGANIKTDLQVTPDHVLANIHYPLAVNGKSVVVYEKLPNTHTDTGFHLVHDVFCRANASPDRQPHVPT